MLTGEYVVLDGANALAIPTKFGQKLLVKTLSFDFHSYSNNNKWQALNFNNEVWIDVNLDDIRNIDNTSKNIFDIVKVLKIIHPHLFEEFRYEFISKLEFPNNWGLGSSSTLISLLAQWADVNPYLLLDKTFGGSGYDIACATAKTPIIYNVNNKKNALAVELNSSWTKDAYFVFLNKKQNSREAIAYYKTLQQTEKPIDDFNNLTEALVQCSNTDSAIEIVQEHENLMSNLLKTERLQSKLFSNFIGKCKSLGAWGGDFILAVSKEGEEYVKNYFENKGYNTIFKFEEMIWKE